MTYEVDTAKANTTLDNGESISLVVETGGADEVKTFIDDGTQDGNPSQYDMIQRITAPDSFSDDFIFYAEVTGETSRSWSDPAVPDKWETEITNTSGNDGQTYRVHIKAINREIGGG